MPQQITPHPTEFNMDQMLSDEASGNLPQDAADMLMNWRAQGLVGPKKETGIGPPPAVGFAGRARKAVGEFVTDPTKSMPLAGQAVGATAGGMVGGLPGAIAGGAIGQAGGRYAGEAIHQGKVIPDVPASDYGAEALEGGVGELGGRLLAAPFKMSKRPMTAVGRETYSLLGDKASIPDLVQSPFWDFANNVTREGFLGKANRQAHDEVVGKALLDEVGNVARSAPGAYGNVPTPPPTKGSAGRKIKQTLLGNYKTEMAQAGAEYEPWMQQNGDMPIDPFADKSPTVRDFHALRSEALKRGRQAAAANDRAGQREAMQQAEKLHQAMADALQDPADIGEYDRIGKQFGLTAEKFDNPTVRNVRKASNMPEEKVMDAIHNRGLTTEAPFREQTTAQVVPGRNVPGGMTVSESDAASRLKAALGPDAAHEMRADSIFTLAKDATTTTESGAEILDGHKFANSINTQMIPEEVQNVLWGSSSAQRMQRIARVTEHVQRARQGAGALWIIMKQPSAALGLAAGIGSAVGAGTGSSALGMATSGTIILAPWVLSKIIDSPAATRLFVQTIGAPTGSMKAQLLKQLTAQIAQRTASAGTSEGMKAVINPKKDPSMTDEGSIPIPPTR